MKNITKKSKQIAFIVLFSLLTICFVCNDVFAKETLGEKTLFGLGGKDYRWPVTWITKKGNYGPGDYGRKIKSQGLSRFYKFHIPMGYKRGQPIPVILILHGGGGYPGAVQYQTDFDKIADKEGFIAVFPAGHHRFWKDRLLHWNDGRTAKNDSSFLKIDDVGFIAALLDDLSKLFNVDESRIYVTGLSNGSMMTYRLGAELSDRIAAVAPVGGQRAAGEYGQIPLRPIPIIHFHGKMDNWAKFEGGKPTKSFFQESLNPVEQSIKSWALHNKCAPNPAKNKLKNNVEIRSFTGCQQNKEIILVILEDGGHTWPGGKMTLSEKRLGIGPINNDISAMQMMWDFFKSQSLDVNDNEFKEKVSGGEEYYDCGNGVCEDDETKSSCPNDCDETTCREFYGTIESDCINNGWKKISVDVDGIERELLWKAPNAWSNGAIIVLHGGEGTSVLVCGAVPKEQNRFLSDILRGVPAVEFGELAIKEGFAVFSLNSTFNRATDPNGLPIGKRWDSLAQDKKNIDLDFIQKVIDETIPGLRPDNSKDKIFITGISNGGFMATLASTHFNDKITAFAPVASGDPYGMYFDMTKEQPLRKCGPGTFRDLETKKEIHHEDSCKSDSYLKEKKMPLTKKHIPFKQFYHEGDRGVHISCMEKARDLLIEHGYQDAGAFIMNNPDGKRTLEKHFWQYEYNQPILNFFKKYSRK